jgi:small subunit ribosomal protein S20
LLKLINYDRILKHITNFKGEIYVPNIKSQAKRVEVSAEENKRNNATRSKIKNAVKKYNAAIKAEDVDAASALLSETVSVINKAKSSGVLHINTASRKVASLNNALEKLKKAKAQ